jgi:hypothetical protein
VRGQSPMSEKSVAPAVTIEQARLTTLLRDAAGELGLEALRSLLNPPLEVTLSVHATGCHAWIDLRSEDLPRIRVWEGSVWYSACYAFNDECKRLGLQAGCDFALPEVDAFFARVQEARAEQVARVATEGARQGAQRRQAQEQALVQYKSLLLGQRRR